MATQISLYRKWRPQTFEDLKGQDVIRDTLRYALTHNQMSQAYLFCGPRGTGKTTTARLIAKLVNCLAEGEEKPCNTCSNCLSITDGANLDIIEVDAASNRGIDEIRQLRDSVRFAPTQARYKVFIIDEVHMLTREAFNALLKTLEEPPSHALFILATTEAHKIPATIISRCQRYDFRLATLDGLTTHLMYVAEQEGMNLAPDAARFIARLGDGSFRDSLSLLDQVRAANHPEYTLQVVEEMFGYIPVEQMATCLTAILSGDLVKAHGSVDAALARGADLRAFCDQLLALSQQCLEALVLQEFKTLPSALGTAVQGAGLSRLVQWLELLLEAIGDSKLSPIPRLPLDVAITKLNVAPQAARAVQPMAEVRVATPPAIAAGPSITAPPPRPQEESVVVPMQETVSVPVMVAVPHVVEAQDWQRVLEGLKKDAPSLLTSLSGARVTGVENGTMNVAVKYKMHADKVNQVKNKMKIEVVLQEVFQVPLKIEAVVVKDMATEDDSVDVASVFEFEE
ncbi:MAG TPA: DNA polymerase III subunit gamma/tau [Patescibacteria group bacterium]